MMKHADGHVHTCASGPPDARELLNAMDRDDCELLILLSPDPREDCWGGGTPPADGKLRAVPPAIRRARMEATATLVRQAPDRLVAFAWLDPEFPEIRGELDLARDLGFSGIKMIPRGWYPSEPRFRPVFARIEELRMPMLFHTGILWSYGDTSGFCISRASATR